MTEAGNFVPENVQKAFGLVAPDVSPELKFKSTDTDAFFVIGQSLGVDPQELQDYQQAREQSGLLRGRGKNRVPELSEKNVGDQANKLAMGVVRLLNEGNPTGYEMLEQMYTTKNYDGLVRVAAALNQLAVDSSEESLNIPQAPGAPGGQAQQGEHDMFGDLKMTAKIVAGIRKQLPQIFSAAFRETAPANSERTWGFAPVQDRIPQGYDFSLPENEDPNKPEHALIQGLSRKHIFMVDMLTRGNYFFQLQRTVIHAMGSLGMHFKDLIGVLPGALQAMSQFSNELNGNTEKSSDQIGAAAPEPIQIEGLMQAFHRELGVRAVDKNGKEQLFYVQIGTAKHLDALSGNTAEHEVIEQPRFVDNRHNKKGENIGYKNGEPFTLADLFLDTTKIPDGKRPPRERTLEDRVQALADADGPKTGWKVGTGPDERDLDDLLDAYKNGSGKSKDRLNVLINEVRGKQIYGMGEQQIVYQMPDGRRIDIAEVFFSDMSETDRMEVQENGVLIMGEGVPLYTHPDIRNGEKFYWAELSDDEQKTFEEKEGGVLLTTSGLGTWHAEIDQFNLSNTNSDFWGTTPNGPRAYNGKSFFYDEIRKDIEHELEQRGLSWADVQGFENDMADGAIADVDHWRVEEIYQAKGGDAAGDASKEARAKYMLMEMIYVRYGSMINMALDVADLTQLSVQHDVAQLADNLAELWIKGLAKESYVEKYQMYLAALRPAIQTFIKPLLWWKSEYIDPIMASLKGDVLHSPWRDYLNPDNTPAGPILMTKDGKTLSDEQKNLLTILFYDKTDHILNWGPRHGMINYLRQQSEALLKAPDDAARKTIQEGMEMFVRATSKRVQTSFKNASPQGFPRSRNDALSFVNGFSVEQRALLKDINFKPLLDHLGYKNMELEDGEYEGWRGATKLVEVRSTKHFHFGKLEKKLFKYMGKYPGMAVGAASTIEGLFKTITQAEPTWMSKYLGKPEGLGGFTADSALEGIITGVLDWTLFFNKRTAKEAHDYIEGIVETIAEAQGSVGFHDQMTVRTFGLNLLAWAMKRSEITDELPNYEFSRGGGEPGTVRNRVEVELVPQLSDPTSEAELRRWAEDTLFTIESYRRAGARVIFPYKSDMRDFDTWAGNTPAFDKSLLTPSGGGDVDEMMRFGKLRMEAARLGYTKLPNAYVVTANSPVYKIAVDLDKEDKTKVNLQKVTGIGQTIYGHLGGEPLMLAIMAKMAQDKNIITEIDAGMLFDISKKMMDKMPWYKRTLNKWIAGEYVKADGETTDVESIVKDMQEMKKQFDAELKKKKKSP